MMKKLLLFLFLLSAAVSLPAQTTSTARRFVNFGSAPTNCGPGAVYYNSASQTTFFCNNSQTWVSFGGGGGVTSLSGDGTIITNSASTGAVTLTIAGTSGGVPYFNTATSWASSAALTNHAIMTGGGAGGAPTVGNGDFTIDSTAHTLLAGASGLVDLHSEGVNGFKLPANAAVPTASAACEWQGNQSILCSNGSGWFGFAYAGGLNSNGTTCSTTFQYVVAVSAAAAPTCSPLGLSNTSQKSETGSADTNVLTFTPPASAGMYRACFDVSVSAATSGVIGWTLNWTDSNGNAQSNIAEPLFQAGTAAPANTFTTSAAGNYGYCVTIDVNNAQGTVVFKWVGGGTTTAKVSASIERII